MLKGSQGMNVGQIEDMILQVKYQVRSWFLFLLLFFPQELIKPVLRLELLSRAVVCGTDFACHGTFGNV